MRGAQRYVFDLAANFEAILSITGNKAIKEDSKTTMQNKTKSFSMKKFIIETQYLIYLKKTPAADCRGCFFTINSLI